MINSQERPLITNLDTNNDKLQITKKQRMVSTLHKGRYVALDVWSHTASPRWSINSVKKARPLHHLKTQTKMTNDHNSISGNFSSMKVNITILFPAKVEYIDSNRKDFKDF